MKGDDEFGRSLKVQRQEIIDRIHYQYLKTNGSVKFPESFEGDVLRLVYKYLRNNQL